ncbi:MAG: 7,8-dihydro-8-oxoguanine-triphosphatase/thiamin-phosphate pyrophosphorylase-like protein [Parcubacteria group bacterium Gr01-1014_48]|nr:MAG: 7,8-dihydro-8-oxoguanine-triphosphatase/thiamin-phosphate pyrophosphorylase-like protein [Parcubacteria group bacterium Greene0416_14]TSC73944.1 MAG: 7,8-dihydro-8-oxoguanine-triphosphatase/thiamin-phosphate pyrophosphorylase-like protein [Parcubacteria group bacterium Gr01-1014_48]TSD00939.1 MAG: 7,8-dihydro-8-oxoguanine-triphosphatase/thiamin-phosphate pyrophosphorylase-like protein [Parcubacteria group bacterium Greene1014_15]TSD07891.1 MAG: 7,8-dihydro-8-oxoguanine-triphosphatase/thi
MKDTALVIFVDSKGLVLLQQKTYDAPHFPGVWSLFGGTIEGGETALEAAQRETKEELGLVLRTTAFTFFRDFPSLEKNRTIFVASIDDTIMPVLQEGRGLGYFSKKEIEHLNMPLHIRKILRIYFDVTKKTRKDS